MGWVGWEEVEWWGGKGKLGVGMGSAYAAMGPRWCGTDGRTSVVVVVVVVVVVAVAVAVVDADNVAVLVVMVVVVVVVVVSWLGNEHSQIAGSVACGCVSALRPSSSTTYPHDLQTATFPSSSPTKEKVLRSRRGPDSKLDFIVRRLM